MAPVSTLLSPAELSYLHASLALDPPVRPDGRSARQFRPLVAEADILPSANGSARVCFSDGTEAVVGVKAEVQRTEAVSRRVDEGLTGELRAADDEEGESTLDRAKATRAKDDWVEISVEVPGFRDDDALPIFLAQMLTEGLVGNGRLRGRLWINSRFHWKLYVDVSVSLVVLCIARR